jgi:hypothetical protein
VPDGTWRIEKVFITGVSACRELMAVLGGYPFCNFQLTILQVLLNKISQEGQAEMSVRAWCFIVPTKRINEDAISVWSR